MAKIRFTKNELKRQKDDLKRFRRYLPTLILKKQQLQMEIIKIQKEMKNREAGIMDFKNSVNKWIDIFAEEVSIDDLVTIDKIDTAMGNIAGIDIPLLSGVDFKEKEYDFVATPLWVDYGIEAVKKMIVLKINLEILKMQMKKVKEELRVTTQRVNLFEKVKIPEAKENIRRIQIYTGDLQTAAVAIGKIAKEKIQRKETTLVPV